MKKNRHMTSSAKLTELPAAIIGIATATLISFLLTVALTSLVMNGTVGESSTGPYIFAIRTIASAIGCFLGALLLNGKYLIIAGTIALGYLAVLIGTGIILYDGSFNNMLSGTVSVLLGGIFACVVVLKPLKKSKNKARYTR